MKVNTIDTLRQNALHFLRTMQSGNSFAFQFSPSSLPNLIGTSFAAMLGGLTDYTRSLDERSRRMWAGLILDCQRPDGWFEDEDIAENNLRPGYGKDRALLHRTRHALMGLHALGERPGKRLAMTEQWIGGNRMRDWCERLNLSDYWHTSNMMMDAAFLLLEAARHWQVPGALEAVDSLLDFCDAHIDPKTGYHDAGRSEVRNAMAGAMHLYPVYVVCRRPILQADRAIETTLRLQQSDGLFGYESGTGGEDCLDYDAVCILCNLGLQNPAYKPQILRCFQNVREGLGICENSDGGFAAHRRKETYYFGTKTTPVASGESSLWATYSRCLTLVMMDGYEFEREPSGWRTGHNLFEVWDGGRGWMSCQSPGSELFRKRELPA